MPRSRARLALHTGDGEREAEESEEAEGEGQRQTERRERAGEMCNKRIAGQRSRIDPGLFEKDLNISRYDSALLKPRALKRVYIWRK